MVTLVSLRCKGPFDCARRRLASLRMTERFQGCRVSSFQELKVSEFQVSEFQIAVRSQFHAHFVAGTEAERFIEGTTFGAGMEDDEIDVIRPAPIDGRLHQATGKTSATKLRLSEDVQNVATTRA